MTADSEMQIQTAGPNRAIFEAGLEACRQSVLTPRQTFGLGAALRHALAVRMSLQVGQPDIAADYRARLAALRGDAAMLAVADGAPAAGIADPFTAAVVRQADLVTLSPGDARREDIEALAAAGLSNPQIVALSELIAFVNYETRVAAGLALLGGA